MNKIIPSLRDLMSANARLHSPVSDNAEFKFEKSDNSFGISNEFVYELFDNNFRKGRIVFFPKASVVDKPRMLMESAQILLKRMSDTKVSRCVNKTNELLGLGINDWTQTTDPAEQIESTDLLYTEDEVNISNRLLCRLGLSGHVFNCILIYNQEQAISIEPSDLTVEFSDQPVHLLVQHPKRANNEIYINRMIICMLMDVRHKKDCQPIPLVLTPTVSEKLHKHIPHDVLMNAYDDLYKDTEARDIAQKLAQEDDGFAVITTGAFKMEYQYELWTFINNVSAFMPYARIKVFPSTYPLN